VTLRFAAKLLRTIAVLSKELVAVRLVNKVRIAKLCYTDKRVTRNENNGGD
jgi:hypothetical protein